MCRIQGLNLFAGYSGQVAGRSEVEPEAHFETHLAKVAMVRQALVVEQSRLESHRAAHEEGISRLESGGDVVREGSACPEMLVAQPAAQEDAYLLKVITGLDSQVRLVGNPLPVLAPEIQKQRKVVGHERAPDGFKAETCLFAPAVRKAQAGGRSVEEPFVFLELCLCRQRAAKERYAADDCLFHCL